MEPNNFNFRNRLKSFKFAFNGLNLLFKFEHNARIHLFLTILVCLAGFFLEISKWEWIILIINIGLVFMTEIVNSAIERIANFVSIEKNEEIKNIKDLSAAAVLVTSIAAAIVGLIIFLPKIYLFLFKI